MQHSSRSRSHSQTSAIHTVSPHRPIIIHPPSIPKYDQLLLYALNPRNLACLAVNDVYQLSSVRRREGLGYDDTAFFIIPNTTYPIRMIQLVGFISAISFNPVDRDRSTAAGVDLRMTITLDDGDGVNTITVIQILRPRLIVTKHPLTHMAIPSTSTSIAMHTESQGHGSSSRSKYHATLSSTWITTKPTSAESSSSSYRKGDIKGKGHAVVAPTLSGRRYIPRKDREEKTEESNVGPNGYPSIPTNTYSSAYAHDRRYIPKALRTPLDPKTDSNEFHEWKYEFPDFGVGDIIRVRGRVKEWKRRNGVNVREMEVVERDCGMIEKVTPAIEHEHIFQTQSAWNDIYTKPLKPFPVLLVSSNPTTPTKRPRVEETRSSPTASVITDGGSSVRDSPARLRHPSKLRSAHITLQRLQHYVSTFISNQSTLFWSDFEFEDEQGMEVLSHCLPELRGIERIRIGKENMVPGDGNDTTPRPGKIAYLEQATPTASRNFVTKAAISAAIATASAASLKPITLEELQYVPHLRLFARRLYDLEDKRLKRQRRKEDPSYDAQIYRNVQEDEVARRKDRETRRRRMRRIFRDILIELSERGWLIEVNLSENDVKRRQEERRNRNVTFESSMADSTINSSYISALNASVTSTWGGEPEDNGSSEESDGGSELKREFDKVGYLPLIQPIIGRVILYILHSESILRRRRYLPKNDPRRTNGLDSNTIANRMNQLAQRWERVNYSVIEEGLQALIDLGHIVKWGTGWWPSTLPLGLPA